MTTHSLPTPTKFGAICIGFAVLAILPFPSVANTVEAPIQLAMMDNMPMQMPQKPGEMTSGGQMGGAAGMSGGMGCCMGMGAMGQAPGSGTSMNMATSSALPGFPGASHLYHVGSTGYFLDHLDKVALSADQQTKLNGVKQQALKDQADRQRQIDAMEEELWFLTASEKPDIGTIETKLREAEKAKSDKRIAFIRTVGEAASVLTADQQKMLLGKVPMPAAKNPAK
jgi:hypothetical protein